MTLCFIDLQRKLFSILVCYSTLSASALFCQTNEKSGYLKVIADSNGIEIRLNEKLLGSTPLPIIALPPGDYQVTAPHPNPYVWGNLDWQDSIKIVADDTVTIQPAFKRRLHIRTHPFDASLFLNNEYLGNSPLSISINSHPHLQLHLKKEGFEEYSIDLDQVKNNFLTVDLITNHVQSSQNQLSQELHNRSKHRYRAAAYSLWGLSILTGLSTVYLKDQADGKYNQYLVAGSLKDMNNYYNDAKRYDRYTYISMGVLQGCFVASFYFLMKSLE